MTLGRPTQQTVRLAVDCKSGGLLSAEHLLELDDSAFAALRRETIEARLAARRSHPLAGRLKCALCKQPVFLSRHVNAERKNRWFVHDGTSSACPWSEGSRLSPEQVKALIYRGQQEGSQHRDLKTFIATWLSRDPEVADVDIEQTTISQVVAGEWRRPDVKCRYRGVPLVFEIQLSYTFLSDVILRDRFYRREGVYIIWVFAQFALSRAAVSDEVFFNKRNLFVVDQSAKDETCQRGILTFSGFRQVPTVDRDLIVNRWGAQFVHLSEVQFPEATKRPYFFDYDVERQKASSAMFWAKDQAKRHELGRMRETYLATALQYYAGEPDGAESELLAAAGRLCTLEPSSADALRDWHFYGCGRVLWTLLSIRNGVVLSHSDRRTLGEVILDALDSCGFDFPRHGLAIIYLWSYKVYGPNVGGEQRARIAAYAMEVRRSVDAGDSKFVRYEGYDRTISFLFPDMTELIESSFGSD